MPEEQNVWGKTWHKRFNQFLRTVMNWEQLGDSETDIPDPMIRTDRKRGIDSVFAYRRNPRSSQQIVLVEAKTVERMQNLRKSHIQDWITTLLTKLERLPMSEDFREKYQPETDAQYELGLIGLWVRDVESYSQYRLREWLSQIHAHRRTTSYYIALISNDTITKLLAIHDTISELENSESFQDIGYYFPDYGVKPSADGTSLPLSALFSKFIFCKGTRLGSNKHGNTPTFYDDISITFYLGEIQNYHDLRFVGLALRDLQLFKSNEAIIYTLQDPIGIRNQIANFKDEFSEKIGANHIEFRQLTPSNQLPSWMVSDD